MKKITIILAAVALVIVLGVLGCNRGKAVSTNNEGIIEDSRSASTILSCRA